MNVQLWLCILTLATSLSAHAKPALKANYLPIGPKMEGCPNYVVMRANSLKTLDFLKRMYRTARIVREETGVPLSHRYLVYSADLQPNTLVITVTFTGQTQLTWSEALRDKNGKTLIAVDGLCSGGQYATAANAGGG